MTEAKEAAASKTHGKSGPLTIFLLAFGLFCGGLWNDALCLKRGGGLVGVAGRARSRRLNATGCRLVIFSHQASLGKL